MTQPKRYIRDWMPGASRVELLALPELARLAAEAEARADAVERGEALPLPAHRAKEAK